MRNELSERQKQLGEFLRYMREHVSPEEIGLSRSARRRTPGLRREEVAEIIGVSTDWYAWLEQGRDVHPSEQVVNRLGQAFRLSVDQITYLGRLARPRSKSFEETSVPARLIELINSFPFQPAYIRNLRWDILASNAAHSKVFDHCHNSTSELPNMLRLFFTDPRFREVTLNWDEIAQEVVAKFRADWSWNPEDEGSVELVRELEAKSPEFSKWWTQYSTKEKLTYPLELQHPVGGRISLDRVTMHPEGELRQSVVVYLPAGAASMKTIIALCK
ncbi:helix-turn-helix transcriptional regulator [Bradyrhizobium macuxiense]|uniref:helix-turn-helix transcriptional regulator n=1 Tax=Bradyrhizobium macuxiense TaxID=1755647 RepID=UPI0013655AA1|nr:helix-turn-helix transcriptional regulator [Bradyrhizobium macuxiense]